MSLRFEEWRRHAQHHSKEGDSYICDLDHHPSSKGPSGGKCFPTFLTHHTIYSWREAALATPSDLWLSLGVDVDARATKRRLSPLTPIFNRLPHHKQQILRGNSMHVPSITAWMVYVFCHCAPRAKHEQMQWPLGDADVAEEVGSEL